MIAPESLAVALTLNGRALRTNVAPQTMLADLLRDQCGLTGTKIGCDQATCGACTVLVDGAPVAACATFAWQADGTAVTTIEGLATNSALTEIGGHGP
jgi:aerobic-type carbon monoxide dehydrogenase small subunit (CoxS/CutS family)